MNRFRTVIAGGGVAAMEGMLRLRRLAGDSVDITLVCPNDEFAIQALTVGEPFSLGAPHRHDVDRIVRSVGATRVPDSMRWLDTAGQVLHTEAGLQIPYDALLLAVGGTLVEPVRGLKTFRPDRADELFRGVVQDIEDGYSKSVAFVAPAGPSWPLPLYEMALMTAERAYASSMEVKLSVVTPERVPLEHFGSAASEAVSGLLSEANVAVFPSAGVKRADKQTLELTSGAFLKTDRAITMPEIAGPAISGIPSTGHGGFIAVDGHCAVKGLGGDVFAAGDGIDFPVKHGGLAAQQADVAAAMIARLAGADAEPEVLRPVIRGKLLTGGAPLYMSARIVGGGSFESEVSDEPLWPSDRKVDADEIAAWLGHAVAP